MVGYALPYLHRSGIVNLYLDEAKVIYFIALSKKYLSILDRYCQFSR